MAVLQRASTASTDFFVGLLPVHVLMVVILVSGMAMLWRVSRARDVYLVDYGCFLGEPRYRIPSAMALEHARLMTDIIEEESADFMARLHERSGIGEETSVPDSYRYMPPERGVEASRVEAELVISSAVDKVFARTTVNPKDIDTLIVACSFTTLTPVFADVVVNKYRLRADVQSVNLSGMGCSGALICVGLAQKLLQAAPPGKHKHVLIIATEILSSMLYNGTKREMLVPNVLFRMGAAAMIMTNSPERARFRLGPIVRTLTAARDSDYRCAFQEEDDKGITGINLSKELPVVAANALKSHIVAFCPRALPALELLRVAFSLVKQYVFPQPRATGRAEKGARPAFNKVFQHFCIHPGGRRVLHEVQRGLGLSDRDMEASHMTLHRFGNMASSSLLYELAYIEAKGRMSKGDRVCMISFSPGIDCSSVVWECINPAAADPNGPWAACIHRYPVHAQAQQLPQIAKMT
ncbi:3-ketoacyl-CoA synthase 6-like [Aegilops tauschii subsp. strangulata]|uniref:3-ketoacyl-CoA synthase 6-like n=1 Tax=Aegilops tauschii subsp. strangulata TaxID=200361 RepID=UPI00098B486C|nr:3-ketoacyl-CoA synthase 6-like [Aegilops tauschii subsp. strangulata]